MSMSKSHERPVATYPGTKRLGVAVEQEQARLGGPGELGSGPCPWGQPRGQPRSQAGRAPRSRLLSRGHECALSEVGARQAAARHLPRRGALRLRVPRTEVLRSEGCRRREQDQRQGRRFPESGELSRC